jgi:hypothetical protein
MLPIFSRIETMISTASKLSDIGVDELVECFDILDSLRATGTVNMFGAAPVLVAWKKDITLPKARIILTAWQDTFSDTVPVCDRACNALDA